MPVILSLSLGISVVASAEPAAREPNALGPLSDPSRRAAARYQDGVSAYAAGRYKDAIDCFRDADALAPSSALSFNTALAYGKVFDTAGALSHYREYLRRDPNALRAESVRERIRQLESVLAGRGVQQVTVQSEPAGATVVVDDKPLGVTPWTFVLAPGGHVLELRLLGYSALSQRFTLALEHAVAFDFPLRRASEPARSVETLPGPRSAAPVERGSPSPWPWLVLGGGAASFLAAGTFELMRQSAERHAKAQTTQIGYDDAFRDAQADRTKARVFAGIGGGLALTGGVLLFALRPPATERRSATLGCDAGGCFGSWKADF